MHLRTRLSHRPLPDEAAPFVRELLLEISRRIPIALGHPPPMEPASLTNGQGCVEASQSLLQWFETIPQVVGERAEEVETVSRSLLRVVQEIDARLRRAVRQARGWVEEDLTFSRSIQEVLQELNATMRERPEHFRASDLLRQILSRIRSKEEHDSREAMALSARFDRIRGDLEALRGAISRLETEARILQDQSLRDGLTGLWNRRAFQGRMEEESNRAARYGATLSILLWDVDGFKAVNESLGHAVGDRVLQALSERVLRLLRRSDVLARCGGDEFAVILPSTRLPQACVAAEKIRSAAEALPSLTGSGADRITVSVGAASWIKGDTADTLFDRAGEALSRAKSSGRNRVEAIGLGPEVQPPLPSNP